MEICHLQEITSENNIKQLKASFARFGIPKILYSDNGPQYSSSKFKHFSKTWNFEHRTSSPEFPQSNGMTKCHIQTVKLLFKKAEYEERDPFLVLMDYRNTLISSTIPSPIELMIDHKISCVMPIKEDFFPNQKYDDIRREELEKQLKYKEYYDRTSKILKPLQEGENGALKLNRNGPPCKGKNPI